MYTEPEEAKPSVVEENNPTAAQQSNGPAAGVLEHSSELVELLSNMPSVLELLSQAAQGGLAEQERQVTMFTVYHQNTVWILEVQPMSVNTSCLCYLTSETPQGTLKVTCHEKCTF